MPGWDIRGGQGLDHPPRSSMLKTHKVLPRPDHGNATMQVSSQGAEVQRESRSPESLTLVSPSKRQTAIPASVGKSQVASLPPTPPENTHEASRPEGPSKPILLIDREFTTPANPSSGISTPLGQLSPPTPANTPPADYKKSALDIPRSHRTASSRTDSFKTAREDQDSSDEGGVSSSPSPHKSLNCRITGAALVGVDQRSGEHDRGYKGNQNNADDDQTPTQELKGLDFSPRNGTQGNKLFKYAVPRHRYSEKAEWQNSLPAHKFSSPKKPQLPSKKSQDTAIDESSQRTDTGRVVSLRERVVHNRETVDRRSAEGFAARISWPLAPDDFSTTGLTYNVDPRRFSQTSASSTVVEALVFEPSPQSPPPLRHKRRIVSLRDQGSTDTTSSIRQQRRWSSLAPETKLAGLSKFDAPDDAVPGDKNTVSNFAGAKAKREPNSPIYAHIGKSSSTVSVASGSIPSRSSSSTVQLHPQLGQPRGRLDQRTVKNSTGVLKSEHDIHLSAPLTPYLQVSNNSTCEALEVSQATAVNIYPHNNNSLLVVQQRSRPVSREYEENGMTTHAAIPCTMREAGRNVADSPSWRPPEPPAFKIIPPTPDVLTPSQESERQLGERSTEPAKVGKFTSGGALSLVKRALGNRRHSDSFVTSSARCKGIDESTQTSNPRRPSLSGRIDSQLSPFWRPRGFWDDLEGDSEVIKEEFLERGRFETSSLHAAHRRQRSVSTTRREDCSTNVQEPQTQRRTHTIPALGVQVEFVGWKGIQSRIENMKATRNRKKKEAEQKLTKRRISTPTAVDPYGI